MNIDEFKRKVSRCVELVEENSLIFLCPKGDEDPDDAFLVIDPYSANLSLDFEDVFIEDVPFDRFVTVLEIVKELRYTPVEERFPEKKYRIRFSGLNSDNGHQYLSTDTIGIHGKFFACALRFGLNQEFTESEIDEMLNDPRFKSVPWFRELICNGKEEVKDDENS